MIKKCQAYHTAHRNGNHFLIARDYYSGRPRRYTVLVWRVGRKAKIIGRELTLGWCKRIINAYPKKAWNVQLQKWNPESRLSTAKYKYE